MKKILGILGVFVFAMTMFMNTNNINSTNSDISLSSLIAINTANAEFVVSGCSFEYFNVCRAPFINVTNCYSDYFGDTCGAYFP